MNTNDTGLRRALSAITGLLLLAGQVHLQAGGPLVRCDNGQPARWPNGGANIPFNPDLGGLGALDATAVDLVESAFGVWAAAPSSTVSYVNAGPLPVDVNSDNLFDYIFTAAPDGLNPIIFDETGEIFDMFFGPDSGVMGFTNPEWIDDCVIMEGYSLLNGHAFSNATEALDVLVHEFGHFTGLDHSVVNGQILYRPGQDSSGPGLLNSFGTPSLTDVETMYEFYVAGSESATLELDDAAALADLYPAAGFAAGSGIISGAIRAANGTTPLIGIHVIARNPANPFKDAVSAISGDHSSPTNQNDPTRGDYTLRGLTPGANYVVYTDQILSGNFSIFTPMLPGVEEFYNGARESAGDATPDDPADFELVPASAGTVTAGINFTFNIPKPGDALAVGDDDSIELALPFPFEICGQTFHSVFVNANGNLTFGQAEPSTFGSAAALLMGPPRIAGWWTDLNPTAGGKVSYAQSANSFTVKWEDVPLFPDEGSNTFSITLSKSSHHVDVRYGVMNGTFGMAGLSAGGAVTTGSETASDLSSLAPRRIGLQGQPALYEVFNGTNDLAGTTVRYAGTQPYNDNWAGHNNSVGTARSIKLPFSSADTGRYTEIKPVGHDVDYFRFSAKAEEYLLIRVSAGRLDSRLGLFSIHGKEGQLVAEDDDSGPGTLSSLTYKVPANGDYAVAVTTSPDTAFTGAGASGGRYVLDVQAVRPDPDNLLLNGSFELGDFAFWHAAELGEPYIAWMIGQNGPGAGFDMAPLQAQDGSYVAWNGFDGCGPMQFVLYQDATIPDSAATATLEWKDRLQWNYLNMSQHMPRSYQVQIRDPATDAVLKVLDMLDTGIVDGLGDSGWRTHSIALPEFIGQAVRVFFLQEIPECYTGPGQYELDDVRLRTQ